jgi:hypothetical protein
MAEIWNSGCEISFKAARGQWAAADELALMAAAFYDTHRDPF